MSLSSLFQRKNGISACYSYYIFFINPFDVKPSTVLLSSRFCLAIIIAAVHDIVGDIVTVLEDLVEIDSLIIDLEDRNYVLSANAYETLKRKCSQDWEAFKYLQERSARHEDL